MYGVHKEFSPALRKVPGIVVGVLDKGRVEVAALGTVADESDPASLCWEIGSITKVFTGLLLADMSIRGEVGLDDPIGLHLPDLVARRLPAATHQPTLTDLATHTAGLPRLPMSIYRGAKRSDDPYSHLTEDDVFAYLGPKTKRPRRRRPRYSNYGTGLLGHLLARAAGRPFAELIEQRILAPLGMTATRVGSCGDGTATVQGFRKGKPTPSWTFGALEAAGGLRSTINDLFIFAGACLDPPEASVGDALRLTREPFRRRRLPSGSMGLGWMLRSHPKRRGSTMWHNGGTYGASSFLAVDPGLSQAIVACGNAGPGLIPLLDPPAWAVFDGLAT
jgi:CubicO group peptidase (beta-lactamase class C family)